MDYQVHEQILMGTLGYIILRHLRGQEIPKEIAEAMESRAVRTLEHIRHILNDETVDDPQCFQRIEAIVNAMEEGGIHVERHDF